MSDEKSKPKVIVKQPGRDLRVSPNSKLVTVKKAPARKAAALKKVPPKKLPAKKAVR